MDRGQRAHSSKVFRQGRRSSSYNGRQHAIHAHCAPSRTRPTSRTPRWRICRRQRSTLSCEASTLGKQHSSPCNLRLSVCTCDWVVWFRGSDVVLGFAGLARQCYRAAPRCFCSLSCPYFAFPWNRQAVAMRVTFVLLPVFRLQLTPRPSHMWVSRTSP